MMIIFLRTLWTSFRRKNFILDSSGSNRGTRLSNRTSPKSAPSLTQTQPLRRSPEPRTSGDALQEIRQDDRQRQPPRSDRSATQAAPHLQSTAPSSLSSL